MKKWNVISGLIVVMTVMYACKADKEQSAEGVIVEASMNTLRVATAKGDTLTISTMDAMRVVKDGILLGDTATVYYKERPESGVIRVTKVVVVPGERECELLGVWVRPIEGMPGQLQGIELEEKGVAKSVNMATLKYEGWKKEGENLILTGKSIGNGQTIVFADTLHIDRVTADSLLLSAGEYTEQYARQSVIECK